MLELLERVDDEVLADLVASAEGLKAWLTAAPANATPEVGPSKACTAVWREQQPGRVRELFVPG